MSELLEEIAPRVTRVAVLFNPATAPYAEYYLKPLNRRRDGDSCKNLEAFGQDGSGRSRRDGSLCSACWGNTPMINSPAFISSDC